MDIVIGCGAPKLADQFAEVVAGIGEVMTEQMQRAADAIEELFRQELLLEEEAYAVRDRLLRWIRAELEMEKRS